MMLEIQHLPCLDLSAPDRLLEQLDACKRQVLTNESWPQIPTICRTEFRIAHTGNHILLKFSVHNDFFRAQQRETNGSVHLDNCVEFFIAFDESDHYYNIEFNCLGVGKMAYGQEGRRTFIEVDVLRKIRVCSTLDHQQEVFNWELLLLIPADVFTCHNIQTFSGMEARANFYKCGDALPHPHYLTWRKVTSSKPNFHKPECFGRISFMPAAGLPYGVKPAL